MRTMLPSIYRTDVQIPGEGKTQTMFKVSFAENLELVARSILCFNQQNYQLPPLLSIAPPISLIFPTKQPIVENGIPIIENGISSCCCYELFLELGIPQYRPHDLTQPVLISMVAGHYQHQAQERQLILDRYDRATHAILQIFWLDGCAPDQAGVNSRFAQRNNAMEFYRTAATTRHCGSDFWLLELKPSSLPYMILRRATANTDNMIASADVMLQAQSTMQGIIRKQFIDSGVVETIEGLGDGWSLEFGEAMIHLECTDNMCNQALLILPYAKGSLAVVQSILESYEADQLDLVEQFHLGNPS